MEPGADRPRAGLLLRRGRRADRPSKRYEALRPPPMPVLRPGPRSAMYFPIVVLVAILPGLYALRNWDLTPPGPWWGMRALAVLEGQTLDQSGLEHVGSVAEAAAYRAVAYQPPLYAWLEALGLWLTDYSPVTTVLFSYFAGAGVVLLVFCHGRLWRGPGLGVAAALLTGFNRDLLVQMQQATPATLGLLGLLLALLAYGHYLRAEDGRRWAWVVVGGLGLGLSLLSVGSGGAADPSGGGVAPGAAGTRSVGVGAAAVSADPVAVDPSGADLGVRGTGDWSADRASVACVDVLPAWRGVYAGVAGASVLGGGGVAGAVGAAADAGAGECAFGAVRGVSGGSEGDAFGGGRPVDGGRGVLVRVAGDCGSGAGVFAEGAGAGVEPDAAGAIEPAGGPGDAGPGGSADSGTESGLAGAGDGSGGGLVGHSGAAAGAGQPDPATGVWTRRRRWVCIWGWI